MELRGEAAPRGEAADGDGAGVDEEAVQAVLAPCQGDQCQD